mmetsp:Transcript_73371/g.202496  ORF Transcript_73371/g.202496 Transcript_73371/m.202496 type:complete len:358 (-) Transcript_73371:479-1552(-)
MAEVLPLHCVGLGMDGLQFDHGPLELDATFALRHLNCVISHGLGLEDNKCIGAVLHALEYAQDLLLTCRFIWLVFLSEDFLFQLEALFPHGTHLWHVLCLCAPHLISPGGDLGILFLVPQVTLKSLHHCLFILTVVPSDGNSDDLLVSVVRDCPLEGLLQFGRPFKRGEAADHGNKVFHGLVTVINVLEEAELSHAVGEAGSECAHVHPVQETDLSPHQPLLSLVTPSNQDAVLAGCSEFACAQNKEVTVNGEPKDHPTKRHEQCPNDDSHLEVEVQNHAGARNLCSEQVCGERPRLPRLTGSLGLVQLLAFAEVLCPRQTDQVGDRADADIYNPDYKQQDNDEQHAGDATQGYHIT